MGAAGKSNTYDILSAVSDELHKTWTRAARRGSSSVQMSSAGGNRGTERRLGVHGGGSGGGDPSETQSLTTAHCKTEVYYAEKINPGD
jgi:hypothetical protein